MTVEKLAPKKIVRIKGPADLMTRVIAKIQAVRPKNTDANRDCTFEVMRSNKGYFSRVKYVLATGIDAYDAAIGIGGLPFGRVTEIYGTDGALKSAVVLLVSIRMQQKNIYERVKDANSKLVSLKKVSVEVPVFTIFIDNEQSIDEDGKTKIDGVQLDIAIARCDTIDQMFKIMDTAIDGVAEFEKEFKIECFVAVIVDTIAGTSSREEVKAKWEDVDYPRQPKQLREGFRVMMRKISRRNVLAVFTNQISEKYQKTGGKGKSLVPQDDEFSTFGGRALKFFASLRIFQTQSNPRYKLNKQMRFPSGRVIEFTVTKNRLGKPWRSGRMVLLYEGGISNVFSILETLIHLKLAERTENGEVKFRFKAFGVVMTTFDPPKENEREHNPYISSPVEWPAFYEQHQEDFYLLWRKAEEIMYLEAAPSADIGTEDESDETSEADVDE